MARRPGIDRVVPSDHVVLGHLRAAGQYHRAMGGPAYPPLHQFHCLAERDPGDLVPGLQPLHDLYLHAFEYQVLDMAGGARKGTVDRYEDGTRLLRSRPLLFDHGRRSMVRGRQTGDVVVAICLFHCHHDRRALSLPHRLVAGLKNRAGTLDLDDDGPLAQHELRWQFPRWLAWWLLEL